MGMPPNSMVYRATIWATTKPYSVQLLVEVESKLLYHHTISFYLITSQIHFQVVLNWHKWLLIMYSREEGGQSNDYMITGGGGVTNILHNKTNFSTNL